MLRFAIFSLCVCLIGSLPPPKFATKVFFSKMKGPRIINGEQAKPGQFPYEAGLRMHGLYGDWFCGGSIISNEWILTAGHCVEGARYGSAITGSTNINEGLTTELSEAILHEEYDGYYLTNDIGLVKVSTPLVFDNNTSSVSLSTQTLEADVEVTVSGWGITSDDMDVVSENLNFVQLITITNDVCNQTFGNVGDGIVCVTHKAGAIQNICDGDSGSPVTVNADSNPEHVAIVSFGSASGCENGAPAGFTRTAYYRDWIRDNIGV